MKRRKKKLLSLFLACALTFSQMSGIVAYAETTTSSTTQVELPEHKSYLDEELVSEGIDNRFDTGEEGLNFVKDLNSFSITMQFKTTSANLQALAAINSSDHANNYITFYQSSKRLGMEIRKSDANTHIVADLDKQVNDGRWHTVTFVVKENVGYEFYLDGELVKEEKANSTVFTGSNGWWTPTSFTLAGANRIGNESNHYPFIGNLRDVSVYQQALTQQQVSQEYEGMEKEFYVSSTCLQYEDFVVKDDASIVDISIDAEEIAGIEDGTFSFGYALAEEVKNSQEKHTLISLSSATEGKNGSIYLIPATGTLGILVEGEGEKTVTLTEPSKMQNTDYHTVTMSFDGTNVKFYFDGAVCGTEAFVTGLQGSGWTADTATLGGIPFKDDSQIFQGTLDTVYLYESVLTESQIIEVHKKQQNVSKAFKSEEYGIFDRNDAGAYGYRIPALTTTKEGTLLAGIDQRNNATTAEYWLSDHGNIDTVVRRSTDGGKTWGEVIKAIDLKSQPYDTGTNSALLIDPCLISTEEGRIWMLVDMFPESTAAVGFGGGGTKPGTGYVEVDGELYQGLYETVNGQDVLKGTLRGSRMYDLEGNPTDYTVDMGNSKDAYHTKGDMYHNGEYVGNIYLHSKNTGNDSAPYHVLVTMYLWLTYSDDDGKTWSNPVDVTPMVKEDWMKFCGVGPGVGLELKNSEHEGRLIFPIYYTPDGSSGIGFQSSACIYSDDGGETWHRSESPNDDRPNSSGGTSSSQNPTGLSQQLTENQIIELNNGHLLQFMRNTGGNGKVAVAKSTDGGTTWTNPYDTNATDVYCQLSVMHYPESVDGKEIIVMSNAAGPGRFNGILRIGEVKEDDSITWIHENMFCGAKYAYSCLSYIGDGKMGLLYEHLGDNVKFTSFNLEYIRQGEGDMAPHITTIERRLLQKGSDTPITDNTVTAVPGDTIQFVLNFDQDVLVKGNPQFIFRIGGLYGNVYTADFAARGEGKRQLIFEYQVQQKDQGTIGYTGPKIVSDDENYVRSRDNYSVSSGGEFVSLGSVGAVLSATEGMTKEVDIPKADMTVTTGSAQGEEPIDRAFDNNAGTLWHSAYNGGKLEDFWVKFDLKSEKPVSGLRYLPRQDNGVNGRILGYQIFISSDDQTYQKVAEGTWTRENHWKWAKFENLENARYVKLVATETLSDNVKLFASAAELRITTVPDHEHTYDTVWSFDDECHYYRCTAVEGCPEKNTQQEHVFGESFGLQETTCTVDGIQGKVCEDCGYQVEESIASQGHVFGEWESVREATQEKTGAKRRICTVCGTYEEEILPKTGATGGNGNENEGDNPGGDGKEEDDVTQQELAAAKAALEAVIATADTKKSEDYTQESWNDFADVLQSAKDWLEDTNATKENLETAKADLEEAMGTLVPAENDDQGGSGSEEEEAQKELEAAKDALAQAVAGAADKKAEDYTEESWAAYRTALENAQTVAEKADATKEELEAAKAALEKAIADLKAAVPTPPGGDQPGGQQPSGGQPGGDQPGGNQPGGSTDPAQKEVETAKTQLDQVMKAAGVKVESAYTKESFAAYQNALQAAQAVLSKANATKEEVAAAQTALQKAITGLIAASEQAPEQTTPSIEKGTKFEDAKGIYQFKIKNEKEAVFTGVSKSIKTVKIANTVTYAGKTFQVTEVAAKALKGDKIVTKVTVGKNVKTIGASAFEGCVKLSSISLGNNTTKIGNKALKGCKALKKVIIPKKVTNLGKSVFEGCAKLSTITIKATALKKVGKNTFKGISAKAKIKVPKKNLAKYKKLLKNKGQGKKVSVK